MAQPRRGRRSVLSRPYLRPRPGSPASRVSGCVCSRAERASFCFRPCDLFVLWRCHSGVATLLHISTPLMRHQAEGPSAHSSMPSARVCRHSQRLVPCGYVGNAAAARPRDARRLLQGPAAGAVRHGGQQIRIGGLEVSPRLLGSRPACGRQTPAPRSNVANEKRLQCWYAPHIAVTIAITCDNALTALTSRAYGFMQASWRLAF